MESQYYREILNNDRLSKEMTPEDFNNTLMHFAELYHQEQLEKCSTPDASQRLSSSLGECVEGNNYEIVADKDGRFWINHKEVGSGEPLEQWIDSVLNVR